VGDLNQKSSTSGRSNHEHPHDQGHDSCGGHEDSHIGHAHHHSPLKNITAAFFLNLFFTIFEIVGGFWTGSVAILADAIHDLGDTISLGLAFYLEKLSGRKRDAHYSYGYRRFSLLSAAISGMVIFAGSLLILWESIPRFWNPSPVHELGMVGFAVVGVIMNGWAALKLAKGESHNEKMLTWHMLEDAIGWVVVLLGALVIHWKGYTWLDPLMAVGLSLWVAWNVLRNLRKTMEVLLQRTPRSFDEAAFGSYVRGLPGVQSLHDLHVWSLDGRKHVLSLHLVLESEAMQRKADIKVEIQKFVERFGSFHTTIETEEIGESCHENCDIK
jgi:cobalt-zinc-cadmium efflux system protein